MATKTFNLSLPGTLLTKLDRAAKREDTNRSELVRQAVRAYIEEHDEWQRLFVYGAEQARRLGITVRDVDRAVRQERRKTRTMRTKRINA